jgi:hypothetical protein
VSVPLELVFHNIQFKKLEHIGLHLWLLDAAEIIAFLGRHKENLKSLRLRHISLREGKWKDVLGYIRGDLGLRTSSRHLEWVSLRGIGYEERTNVLGGMSFAQPSHRNSPRFDMDSDVGSSDDENNRGQERWRSSAKPSCKCFKGLAWDDLDDNGITVEKQQWCA